MRLLDWEAHLIGVPTDAATNEETPGIATYRNARLAILCNALAGAYPAYRTLVGDDCFDALVHDTLVVQVSIFPSLHYYGNALPDVIVQSSLAHNVPCLADVARLEQCVYWAHYAPDARAEAVNAILLAQPADIIRVGLVEGTQWIVSPQPVMSIQRVYQLNEITVLNVIDLGVSEVTAIAVRGHRVAVVDLDLPAATFLVVCETGTSFQVAFETMLVEWPDSDLTACLSGLYHSGLLAPSVCPTTLFARDMP